MAKPLRILHWNARGLRSKVTTPRQLLKDEDIDMALINETHLGPADRTRFPGYVIYRRDETSAHQARYCGLAVLVRRRVVHQQLPSPPQDSIYTLGVQLHVAGEDVGLYACYKPPATRLNLAELRALLPPHRRGRYLSPATSTVSTQRGTQPSPTTRGDGSSRTRKPTGTRCLAQKCPPITPTQQPTHQMCWTS
uniref:Endonuclease/exonuclease/phosphatase domain-containing protein n=1 Tax=Heliothis virescens TaxID=7102 RepID=A0A2A4JCI4_HELVI